jgi:hypothetical protein
MNLFQISRLFEASSILQSAATGLSQLTVRSPTSAEREAFAWVAEFLTSVDWSANSQPNPALAVEATAVRPVFYNTLLAIEQQFKSAEMTTPDRIVEFLKDLYHSLRAPDDREKLNAESLELGANFLGQISQSLLAQITNNGVPQNEELVMG